MKTKSSGHESTGTKLPRKQSVVWMAMKNIKTKLSLTEGGSSPLNWKVIFLVFVSMFSSSFTLTLIFPFLSEMIKDFGYKEVEKGYYVGIVAGAMFLGRACGSYFWGWLSDRKGRKPVMLITIILNGVVSLAFGFTTDIVYAFVTRFLSGLVNGTVVTAKTVLYEISDDSNQAVGMSVISAAWGIGIILGPTVGGYLANPCKRYPEVFEPEGLFYNFPYVIPGAAAFVISLFAFLMDLFWLPETLSMKTKDTETEVSAENIPLNGSVHDKRSIHDTVSVYGSRNYLSNVKATISVEDIHCESEAAEYMARTGKQIHPTRHGIEITDVKVRENKHERVQDKQMNNTAKNTTKEIDQNVEHYCVGPEPLEEINSKFQNDTTTYSIAVEMETRNKHLDNDTAFDQTELEAVELDAPLRICKEGHEKMDKWSADRETDVKSFERSERSRWCYMYHAIRNLSFIKLLRIKGGLGYQPIEIGAVIGSSSIPLLLLEFILFPNLVKRFGAKKTFMGCMVVLVISTTAMPTLHLVREPNLLWVLLIGDNIVLKMMSSCIFSAISLFINNSMTPDLVGSVNGLAMTATSITRSLAPVVGGAVFAWTVSYSSENIGPPFDISFTFFMFGFIFWLLLVSGITKPERLNKQKK